MQSSYDLRGAATGLRLTRHEKLLLGLLLLWYCCMRWRPPLTGCLNAASRLWLVRDHSHPMNTVHRSGPGRHGWRWVGGAGQLGHNRLRPVGADQMIGRTLAVSTRTAVGLHQVQPVVRLLEGQWSERPLTTCRDTVTGESGRLHRPPKSWVIAQCLI